VEADINDNCGPVDLIYTQIEIIHCFVRPLKSIVGFHSKSLTLEPAKEHGRCMSDPAVAVMRQFVLTLASNVADMFPNATVRGVDLFPVAGDLDAPELRD
jgi:hypothetical protein